jgi:hypothetical protein
MLEIISGVRFRPHNKEDDSYQHMCKHFNFEEQPPMFARINYLDFYMWQHVKPIVQGFSNFR